MELTDYLKILVQNDGSDLYLTAEAPAAAKFQGTLKPLENVKLTKERLKDIAYSLMDAEQRLAFEQLPELNLAISEPGIGRFRINIFKQRGNYSLVIRNIKVDIPNADALGLPQILKKTIMEKRGLILFVGGTGSGKSTSLAALIDYRNSNASGHIITIEDPIEYIHPHKKSLVNQREVGVDTLSYEDALKNTLRQAPDVILIGEIRSQETMEHALAFAETGHLCLSTLHANNANQALDRIINFFPEERRNQLLLDLSLNLKAFVSQRLVPTVEGKRTAAIEILLGTQLVRDLILKGEVHAIKEAMEKSENIGMQTFDSHLLRLFKNGTITLEEALANSDSPNNLKLKINLSDGLGSSSPAASGNAGNDSLSGLSLQAIHKDEDLEDSH
ncbi:MAG: PilT/PilU family type 4a pilus ATPase [Methylococcaceae bacterium]|nr:PilT/PilU family type 4a pilus ATPase [Methylococcaceae bacterium]MDZ4156713.1 PilT/PilU family type 4a pilus ATPase [Methylococcales bacterium]MDP2393383.1 PilT/PilU family type 4a pilus ATPase [Methylococcaceae bacterium]MDP3018296.1 PilT/PilU family type 4a pilus ATPase [Methylococcaceae bacterium]MDP3388514.1 PilT/PilU family type 4a pilus ATPase [Methylococcaceae bacterium]